MSSTIGNLDVATSVGSGDEFVIVQDGANKRASNQLVIDSIPAPSYYEKVEVLAPAFKLEPGYPGPGTLPVYDVALNAWLFPVTNLEGRLFGSCTIPREYEGGGANIRTYAVWRLIEAAPDAENTVLITVNKTFLKPNVGLLPGAGITILSQTAALGAFETNQTDAVDLFGVDSSIAAGDVVDFTVSVDASGAPQGCAIHSIVFEFLSDK